MSIKNGPAVSALFIPRSALVDKDGIPTTGYGRAWCQAVSNRTGGSDGIVPVVNTTDNTVLSSAGTNISNAAQLQYDWNYITVTPAGGGVAIASQLNLQPGNFIQVINGGTQNILVYPPAANVQIDALGNGNPYTLATGKLRFFECVTATQFYSYGN